MNTPTTGPASGRHKQIESARLGRVRLSPSAGTVTLAIWLCGFAVPFSLALDLDPRLVGQWPALEGRMNAIEVQGGLAYCAMEQPGGLAILDIQDPRSPRLLGRLPTTDSNALAVSGNYAYLTTRLAWDEKEQSWSGGGLHVIDISDPAAPRQIGGFGGSDTRRAIESVAVSGDFAYVTFCDGKLPSPCLGTFQVIRISDPANPIPLGTLQIRGEFGSPSVVNGFVYLRETQIDEDGRHTPARLLVIDVSDPANPFVTNTPDNVFPWIIESVVDGDLLYAAAGDRGFRILDITDPVNPIEVGKYFRTDLDYANEVAVSGSYALVGFEREDHLVILDIRDPSQPKKVGSLRTPSVLSSIGDVALVGRYAFLAGVGVVDILNPANPQRLETFPTAGRARTLTVSGQIAYVAGWKPDVEDRASSYPGNVVFEVVNVEDAKNPRRVGQLALPANGFSDVRGMIVSGGLAYISGHWSVSGPPDPSLVGFLDVIDISHPESPIRLARYQDGQGIVGMALEGSHLYAGVSVHGNGRLEDHSFQVIDVSDPRSPRQIGRLKTAAAPVCVDVAGNYAYAALGQGASGLWIIDISDPQAPRHAASYGSGSIFDVALEGPYAYVASQPFGLEILDISNPMSPRRVGSIPDPIFGLDRVAVAGAHAYVAARDGIHVIDVSDPTHPRRVGGNSASGDYFGSALSVDDGRVHVAAGFGGLMVLAKFTNLRFGPASVQADGGLKFLLSGASGQRVRVQRSADMMLWKDWKTVTLGGEPVELLDADAAGASRCFYRAVEDQPIAPSP